MPQSTKSANRVDVHVGRRVRLRRKELAFSQERLAECLGLTFQQIQKYERGTNRISASKLYEIAKVLNVSIGHFFEGLGGVSAQADDHAATWISVVEEMLAQPNGRDLCEAFLGIRERAVRKSLADLARAIATGDSQ